MANGLTYARVSHGVYDTKQLASTLGPFLRAGDIIMLNGDLGAGKTQFVQGVADSLGVLANVVSPTFNIVLEYQGREMPLYHFDLYRLESRDQLEDIGYWDILEGDGVSFIEWGDKFPQ
ncbi:MAG: tRNA (adenosine(37)-N6)-threonylcarbamoyltransferase complex ATPase subunit type 1 TsaE, partial [Eggerthellaceae bacterium]|nr:tRNA (adenosine(37)-N6)-threonylcarbamoyltransferase complex ATPase subunit type 1 TsaE [Eggerthellaceae bacterium]